MQNCHLLREWDKERVASAIVADPDPDV
jgi:hypothetical protein